MTVDEILAACEELWASWEGVTEAVTQEEREYAKDFLTKWKADEG